MISQSQADSSYEQSFSNDDIEMTAPDEMLDLQPHDPSVDELETLGLVDGATYPVIGKTEDGIFYNDAASSLKSLQVEYRKAKNEFKQNYFSENSSSDLTEMLEAQVFDVEVMAIQEILATKVYDVLKNHKDLDRQLTTLQKTCDQDKINNWLVGTGCITAIEFIRQTTTQNEFEF